MTSSNIALNCPLTPSPSPCSSRMARKLTHRTDYDNSGGTLSEGPGMVTSNASVTNPGSVTIRSVSQDLGNSSQGKIARIKKQTSVKKTTWPKRGVKYVSRHFSQVEEAEKDPNPNLLCTPPNTPGKRLSRIYFGLNVDELSSDSDLTDVPDDIGPDPFVCEHGSLLAIDLSTKANVKPPRKKISNPKKSPYFPLTLTQGYKNKQRQNFVSTLPFPSLSEQTFGLMQERLAHQPFKLLIATIFLNKTPGSRAMPVFYDLMKRYPTPDHLANAEVSDVTAIIHHLGFQNQRAKKCVAMAQEWVRNPPARGRRYRKINYPNKGDGRNVGIGEVLQDEAGLEDETESECAEKAQKVAWEISHLPGLGPYSHDSWRMFCRDELRGLAGDWLGTGAAAIVPKEEEHQEHDCFEPEWKRVLPQDKELRAYLTWMWLKEGWVWNKETGAKTRAAKKLMEIARGGGIVIEKAEKEFLEIQGLDVDEIQDEKSIGKIEKTAGEFLPDIAHGIGVGVRGSDN